MKEKPILFSTDMVRAILDGRKTQTRRIVKEAIGWGPVWKPTLINETHLDSIPRYEMRTGKQYSVRFFKCPYGQVGDVLWVRETWGRETWQVPDPDRPLKYILFKADNPDAYTVTGWKPSIHMPKDAARIWLRIESIVVERLQDITEEDAKREGVELLVDGLYRHYYQPQLPAQTARESFRTLWQHINGPDSWKHNPWVWVVKYKVLSTTGKPNNLITQ
jgi:hypothetical protein